MGRAPYRKSRIRSRFPDPRGQLNIPPMNSLRIDRGLAIHGGVGTLSPDSMTEELGQAYRDVLAEALVAGREALSDGSAVDAVVAAVRVMEDSPLFNAGRGSNFDERGVVTMDASVMEGATLRAGAVAGVTDVRYPVDLARLVMERSPHVLLIGEGAEHFAREQGISVTDNSFFHTERRREALRKAKERRERRPDVVGDPPWAGAGIVDDDPSAGEDTPAGEDTTPGDPSTKAGTVGAVARDASGRLAAATSTGGMADKVWGRVGDSPIIGAGTYASELCAVSCTGWGEYFITHAAAHDVHARMAHAGATLAEAVRGVIFDTLQTRVPGSGGMVALDSEGNVELSFNTSGMYRGWIAVDGDPRVGIYPEDRLL